MNLFRISINYLLFTPYRTAISFLFLMVGVSAILAVINISSQIETKLQRSLGGIDLVVAAKGNPEEIILSNLFHLSTSEGTVDKNEIAKLLIEKAYGLFDDIIFIALGDNYKGFRIVGTNINYLLRFGSYNVETAHFPDKINTALIGYNVAAKTGLKHGDSFISSHGINKGGEEHKDRPYRVIGIMHKSGGVIDDQILVNIDSVYEMHKDEIGENKKASAVFIIYSTPAAAAVIPNLIEQHQNLKVANPKAEFGNIKNLIGSVKSKLMGLSSLFIILGLISMFVAFFLMIKEHTYDFALMRALGGSKLKIASLPLIEASIISVAVSCSGLIAAHIVVYLISLFLYSKTNFYISGGVIIIEEFLTLMIIFLLIIFFAIIPSVKAYRTNIVKALLR